MKFAKYVQDLLLRLKNLQEMCTAKSASLREERISLYLWQLSQEPQANSLTTNFRVSSLTAKNLRKSIKFKSENECKLKSLVSLNF